MDDTRRAIYAQFAVLFGDLEREHHEALAEARAVSFTDGFVRGLADGAREGQAAAYIRGWFDAEYRARAQAGHVVPTNLGRPNADDVAGILPDQTDRAGVVLFAHLFGQKQPPN